MEIVKSNGYPCILRKSVKSIQMGSQAAPEMDQNWSQIGSKSDPQMDPKGIPKCIQKGPQNGPKGDPQMDPKGIPKWMQNMLTV